MQRPLDRIATAARHWLIRLRTRELRSQGGGGGLLFVHLALSSFVREDVRILGKEYRLAFFRFGGPRTQKPGLLALIGLLLRQCGWLLRELPRAEGVYGWFADYHMVLPVLAARLFRKPVCIVVGGFDAIRLPQLGYGVALSWWRWPLVRMVFRMADLLLPVSPSLVYSKNRFSEWPEETEQGLRVLAPRVTTAIHVVPTGYDPDVWPLGPMEREPVVGTVGLVDSDRTFHRKGIDLFLEAARLMPRVRFRVVGMVVEEMARERYDLSANVELLGPVSREELVAHYHGMSVYVQLSRAEGLPNVLCEAMLCGCVPVGSAAFGIPEGIGEAGFVVEEPDPSKIAAVIRRALSAGARCREAARRHIATRFHLDVRRNTLLRVVSAGMGGCYGSSRRWSRSANGR